MQVVLSDVSDWLCTFFEVSQFFFHLLVLLRYAIIQLNVANTSRLFLLYIC